MAVPSFLIMIVSLFDDLRAHSLRRLFCFVTGSNHCVPTGITTVVNTPCCMHWTSRCNFMDECFLIAKRLLHPVHCTATLNCWLAMRFALSRISVTQSTTGHQRDHCLWNSAVIRRQGRTSSFDARLWPYTVERCLRLSFLNHQQCVQ